METRSGSEVINEWDIPAMATPPGIEYLHIAFLQFKWTRIFKFSGDIDE